VLSHDSCRKSLGGAVIHSLPSYFSVFEQMLSLEKKYMKCYTLLEDLIGSKETFALCCSDALKFSKLLAANQALLLDKEH